MPTGTKVISAESWGISAWTKTAKVTVALQDESLKRYFLKVFVYDLQNTAVFTDSSLHSSQREGGHEL